MPRIARVVCVHAVNVQSFLHQHLTSISSLPNTNNSLFSLPNFWLEKLRLKIMLKNQRKLKAFTLTELLVVLGIVGILTLLALPIFDNLGAKAYEAEAEMQLNTLRVCSNPIK